MKLLLLLIVIVAANVDRGGDCNKGQMRIENRRGETAEDDRREKRRRKRDDNTNCLRYLHMGKRKAVEVHHVVSVAGVGGDAVWVRATQCF